MFRWFLTCLATRLRSPDILVYAYVMISMLLVSIHCGDLSFITCSHQLATYVLPVADAGFDGCPLAGRFALSVWGVRGLGIKME